MRNTNHLNRLYVLLLMFLFSCSQPNFVSGMRPQRTLPPTFQAREKNDASTKEQDLQKKKCFLSHLGVSSKKINKHSVCSFFLKKRKTIRVPALVCPDKKKKRQQKGMTPLHSAVLHNDLKSVALLLKVYKAKPKLFFYNFINQKDNKGFTALDYLVSRDQSGDRPIQTLPVKDAREKSYKICDLLLHGSDINKKDPNGYTLAHRAVLTGHNDILKNLIENQSDLSIQDHKGCTVFHLAVETMRSSLDTKNWDLVNYLIEEENSILNQLLALDLFRVGWNKLNHLGRAIPDLLIELLDCNYSQVRDLEV